MKNFIKAGIILFSLTTQLEASLVSNDLVLDNASAMTQLEASLVSNDLVLDNTSATVKVQQKPLPARWPTVVSGIIGVPLLVFGSMSAFMGFFCSDATLRIKADANDTDKKNQRAAFIILGGVLIPIGLAVSAYMVKRIVDRRKAKKVLKMEEQQEYKKTQLVSSSVAHA
jgi:hypothetical protein